MAERILAVSVAPLFEGAVYGGSQGILVAVARALGQAGAAVEVVCARHPGNRGGFALGPGARVSPALALRGYFPDPYEVPPYRLADSARALRPLIDRADRIYLHADIFHFRGLLREGVPVVRSFHDFHYETALVSAFAYGADCTIVPSAYLARCIEATVGRSGVRDLEPIAVIPNGIDLGHFRPGPLSPPAQVRPRESRDAVLLYPHRPDPRKGIDVALRTLAILRKRLPERRVRLLVPRHIDADRLSEMREHYAQARASAAEHGVAENVEFIPWQSCRDMPQLYRFSDVTLCLGNFIESFGLTPYESVACGTPCIAARVGAFRDLPTHPDFRLVDYGDAEAAAAAVEEALATPPDPDGARALLGEQFSYSRMTAEYARVITAAAPRASSPQRAALLDENFLELAPWCHVSGARIYNDYAYGYQDFPSLARFLSTRRLQGGFTEERATAAGVTPAELARARAEGVLVGARRAIV